MDFEDILKAHRARYPRMTPQDFGKLAFQSEFGPAHLIPDEERAKAAILEEWEQVKPGSNMPPEDIGGGLCRFHLHDIQDKNTAASILVKLFILTAKTKGGSRGGLEEKLVQLEKLPVPGMGDWLEEYRRMGCPAVSHSREYRAAYNPHYRLLRREYARFFPALLAVAQKLKEDRPLVVAIDGRCGSGKSTLGELMAQVFSGRSFHMDDFYLPKPRREENWMSVPGGNMDLERFRSQVLTPAFAGEEVLYRPFDCSTGTLGEGTPIPMKKLTIVEGSYSHHPALEAPYDLRIFLTCEKGEQTRRLMEREGDYFPTFAQMWMPLEEQYIRQCGIESRADVRFDTGV